MRRRLWYLLALICSAGAMACGTFTGSRNPADRLQRLEWLIGTWEGQTETATFVERWARTNESRLDGSGYRITRGDTLFSEQLRIVDHEGAIYYVADVGENEREVWFRLEQQSKHFAVFENPDHDFPQRFVYDLTSDGTLHVFAESIDGRHKPLRFVFRKVE